MNKNYYEILQVDKNASQEIIDKAYKTLAKKYHPDLHDSSNKLELESILKKINEAYDVLSNSEKRKKYDETLDSSFISKEDYSKVYEENKELKNKLNNLNNTNDYKNNQTTNRRYNYKNNYKNSFEDYVKNFITLILTIIIIYLLSKIPFIHNFLMKNIIIQKLFK